MKKLLSLALLGATLLAGCGSTPTPTAAGGSAGGYANRPTTGAPTYGQPANQPPAGGQQPGAGQQPATQALAGMQRAWASARTLSATYELYEKGAKGTETATVTFYYKKATQYRYEVTKHSSSIKNGSTLVFDTKTRKTTARLGGVASFLPIHGTLSDDRSISVRGYSLDQTDYATQTELFFAPGARVSQAGPLTLELAMPAKYPGCEVFRAVLDPQKMLPASFELVEKGQVVYRKRFTNLQLNPSLGSDKFSL